jgi:hypothetical protein
MATKEQIAATVAALVVCVVVMGITTYIFGQFMQANSIGPDYCHNLANQEPSFGQSLDATTHFCDYNVSTSGYDFNRTKFIEALSHVES